jgi:transposase
MESEAVIGSEAGFPLGPRARYRVWSGRRPAPGIVAPVVGEHAEQNVFWHDVLRFLPREELTVDTVFARVAGLDVHQKFITVGVRCQLETGKLFAEVRTFGTMTRDLLALAAYLEELGITHVAMESTGVLWKPVWNILDGRFNLLLVNPRHIKQVPGRKSDVNDAEWIAQLLQCGLLHSSFVPPRELRELRDLTRLRAQLVGEQNRLTNRIHKVLEDANIKLGAVASDIMGKSGRAMLRQLVRGEQDPNKLAELALGRLRGKIPELRLALEGHFTAHHRFMVVHLLEHLDELERHIEELSTRIEECLRPLLPDERVKQLDAIAGVDRTTIENVIAEIGVDMSVFPDEHHLGSWAGMCPGTEHSGGKRLRSRTTHKNRWLRRALVEAAWAASRTKNSYLGARYRRLAARRGKKKALVAVGHSLLVIFYHMLKYDGLEYKDLGADYFDRLEPERLQRYLVKRLERLGFRVTLTAEAPTA